VKPPSGGFSLLLEESETCLKFTAAGATQSAWLSFADRVASCLVHFWRLLPTITGICQAAFRVPKEHDQMSPIDQWLKGEAEMSARTPAPKAKDYSVVPGSMGPRRDFRISVGLREGWDADGRVFDVSEAVRTARAWMKRRVQAGQPALSGMFTRAEVTYAWPRPDGTVGSDREPVALFTGEAVHAYLGHLSDEAIEAMLNELSIELGAALGQERIYVAFADRTWILDAGER
jgi:hypothetical protein